MLCDEPRDNRYESVEEMIRTMTPRFYVEHYSKGPHDAAHHDDPATNAP